jgi:hypothetical protein
MKRRTDPRGEAAFARVVAFDRRVAGEPVPIVAVRTPLPPVFNP